MDLCKFTDAALEQIELLSNINITQIAKKLFVSERTVYRYIKSHTGLTPIRFINFLRFYSAKELLLFDFNIDQIITTLNFESTGYFYKGFKKNFGLPPKKYYELNKKDFRIHSHIITFNDQEFKDSYFKSIEKDLKEYYYSHLETFAARTVIEEKILNKWIISYTHYLN